MPEPQIPTAPSREHTDEIAERLYRALDVVDIAAFDLMGDAGAYANRRSAQNEEGLADALHFSIEHLEELRHTARILKREAKRIREEVFRNG